MNKQRTIFIAIICSIMACLVVLFVKPNALDSTISGTCTISVHDYTFQGTSTFDVVMPDGNTYLGYCINSGWPTPIDGTYNFTGTLNSSGTYDITVHSTYTTKDINKIHPLDRPHLKYNLGQAFKTQSVGNFTYAIVRNGYIKVSKTSANVPITSNNSSYSLKDAVYGVYTNYGCTNQVGTLTTDENGISNTVELEQGTYYVKEITAPKGFAIDNTVYTATISANDTTTVNVSDVGQTAKVDIMLGKIDAETTDALPQGDASLKDAEYTVKFYAGQYDTNPSEIATPIKTWVFKTDTNGKIQFNENYKVSGDTLFENETFPLGTLTIQETKAPDGYLLNEEIIVKKIEENTDDSTVTTYNIPQTKEQVVRGDIAFYKMYGNPDVDMDTFRPEEGTVFSVVLKSTGEEIGRITTDKNGYATTKDISSGLAGQLPYGTYTITEIVTPEGHKPVDPFDISITENGVTVFGQFKNDLIIVSPVSVVKVDESTGKNIPVANTEFRILDSEKNPITMTTYYPQKEEVSIFKTDENGQFTLPNRLEYGTYYLEEVSAPTGYLKGDLLEFKVTTFADFDNPLVIKYADKNVMGKIAIEKMDEETGEKLTGATFNVIAKEDIITPDGTIRATKDEIVDTVTTTDGYVETKELYLGEYTVEEVKQPTGYVLDKTSYDVTLEYENQTTPIVRKTLSLSNKPSTVNISKIDEETKEPLSNVTFVIWKENETPIEYKTDKNGNLSIKYLEPGTYHIKEFATNPGYAVKETVYNLTVTEDGRIDGNDVGELEVGNIHVKILGTVALDNKTNLHNGFVDKEASVSDTIKLSGLQVGKEYVIKTTPIDIKTGEPIAETVEYMFVANETNQDVKVNMLLNTSDLDGHTINMFEELYDEGVLVGEHKDLENQDQSIHYTKVKIGTTAKDKNTNVNISKDGTETTIIDTVLYEEIIPNVEYEMVGTLMNKKTKEPIMVDGKPLTTTVKFTPTETTGSVDVTFTFDSTEYKDQDVVAFEVLTYGDITIATHEDIDDEGQTVHIPNIKIGTTAKDKDTNLNITKFGENTTIVDTVHYEGIIPNVEYEMIGTLMNKETKEPIMVDGEPLTSKVKFTPTETTGSIDVTFTFDSTEYKGKDVVVFEVLTLNDVVFTTHEDIDDEGQTVHIPDVKIGTTAKDKDTNLNITKFGEKTTIVDTVNYEGIFPNVEYEMIGTLMNKETKEPIMVDGEPLTSKIKFTPTKTTGSVDVKFTFDSTEYKGKDVVAFEILTLNNVAFATHEDIDDEGQTIHIPEILLKTTATNKKDNGKTLDMNQDVTIVDKVEYEGAIPNKEITIKGILMDKSTGNPLLVNGKEITAETTFTPKNTSGSVELEFTFNTTSLDGKEIVVFESFYYGETEFASHNDINDEGQTVKVKVPKNKITQTGDATNVFPYVLFFVICSFGIYITLKRKKH